MSGQGPTTQRVRKSSPSFVKQGPMRATIPMASLIRQSSNMRKSKSNSPTLSPTSSWKTRISPDHSSGQRSPGSSTYKAKSKTFGLCTNNGNIMRRTASLDTIYLKGQWPRDCFFWHCDILQIDKATQTEDWLIDQRKTHRTVESNDDKLEKMIRHRLQRNHKDGSGSSRERAAAFGLIMQGGPSVFSADHNLILPSTSSQTNTSCIGGNTRASPVNIPMKPLAARPPMRSSIEGLNQEIEKLVLKTSGSSTTLSIERSDDDKYQQITPEGHRAPLADLLRATRSVNTQTPATADVTGSCNSSGPPSRDSISPIIPDVTPSPSEQGDSEGSSPDQETGRLGTSPHINRFLAREPPDGCERVNLKFIEDSARRSAIDLNEFEYSPIRPCTFQLKPSLGSAFYQLQPQTEPDAMPFVPPEQDLL